MSKLIACSIALIFCGCLPGAEAAKKAGDAAGEATVKNEAGEDVKLSSFKDKSGLVVFFFPRADTPG